MALRLASARVSVAVGVRRVLRPVCCRMWAFIQRGFGAVDEDFVLDNRGVESRDEFEEIGLGFDRSVEKSGSSAARARSWSRSVCLASSS
jgi:hypothetical protein